MPCSKVRNSDEIRPRFVDENDQRVLATQNHSFRTPFDRIETQMVYVFNSLASNENAVAKIMDEIHTDNCTCWRKLFEMNSNEKKNDQKRNNAAF